MERLFIYAFIGLVLLAGLLFWFFKKLFMDQGEQEINFGSGAIDDSDMEYIPPAQREGAAYQERQFGIIATVIRKAPKIIVTMILVNIASVVFFGYMSVKNIERISNAALALSQGEYGLVFTALWPIGKEAGVEQWRISTGMNPYLDEKDLSNFAYVGQLNDKSIAIMKRLYSTQDHDENLKESDEVFGNVIIGLSASKAKDICEDKYKGQLISENEWKLSRSHFLAARNVKSFPKIPEWARDVSESDDHDYFVIAKGSGVREYAVKENLDLEENGKYIDNGDLSIAGFRCSITW